jgi:hypothetical protein
VCCCGRAGRCKTPVRSPNRRLQFIGLEVNGKVSRLQQVALEVPRNITPQAENTCRPPEILALICVKSATARSVVTATPLLCDPLHKQNVLNTCKNL